MEANNFLPIGQVATDSPCTPEPTRAITSKDTVELCRRDPRRGSAKLPHLSTPDQGSVGYCQWLVAVTAVVMAAVIVFATVLFTG